MIFSETMQREKGERAMRRLLIVFATVATLFAVNVVHAEPVRVGLTFYAAVDVGGPLPVNQGVAWEHFLVANFGRRSIRPADLRFTVTVLETTITTPFSIWIVNDHDSNTTLPGLTAIGMIQPFDLAYVQALFPEITSGLWPNTDITMGISNTGASDIGDSETRVLVTLGLASDDEADVRTQAFLVTIVTRSERVSDVTNYRGMARFALSPGRGR